MAAAFKFPGMFTGGSSSSSSAPAGGAGSGPAPDFFEPAVIFQGARQNCVFKKGRQGIGYYYDALVAAADSQLTLVRRQLPEKWRGCELRQVRLKFDIDAGCGLSLERSEFGFAVLDVEDEPGQEFEEGDVIVAMEGRLFVGLSAPQMQASFLKRRANGARLQVTTLKEVEHLNSLDSSIVEWWNPQHERLYYFNQKTGKSGWTREAVASTEADSDDESKSEEASRPPAPSAPSTQQAPFAHGEPKMKRQKNVAAPCADLLQQYKNCQAFSADPKTREKLLEVSVAEQKTVDPRLDRSSIEGLDMARLARLIYKNTDSS